jgi:alkanesulfonate monooxygenase SsuD/methylene tetrahydromethanopterin reductase-like flavin-dependent oxidoreductase (luciferase family)
MYTSPKPLQQPHPPIWIGGSSPAALRRAAQFAEVWQPTQTPLEDLRQRQADLREACARIGRQDAPTTRMSFRVNFPDITGSKARDPTSAAERPIGQGRPAQVAADMRRFRDEAGLEAFQINFNGCQNLEHLPASMALFMREVKPLVER